MFLLGQSVGHFSERLVNDYRLDGKTCLVGIVSETTEGAVTKSVGSNGAAKATGGATTIESVADIIEREHQNVIVDWLARVEEEPDLRSIPLSFEDRTGHLP